MRMSEPTERKQVWIGAQIKEQLGEVVKQIGGNRVNLQSYIDLILLDHIATYREEINRIYHKQPKKKEVL